MKKKPENRILGYDNASQETAETDAETQANRAIVVRKKLIVLGQMMQHSKLAAAYLLDECRCEGYWADHYPSFQEYVETEVDIPLRTAQELMRVAAKCREANIPLERVAELGWSKVALVASQLTTENATELLRQVADKTYGQLQETLRQLKRNEGQSAKTKRTPKGKNEEQAPIALSKKVQEALRLACLHTRDQSTEVNLEFIAAKFMELCPPPSLVSIDPSPN